MGGGNQSHRINVSMYQGFKDSWYQSINITRTLGDNRLRFYAFHRFYQRPLLSLVTPTRGVGGLREAHEALASARALGGRRPLADPSAAIEVSLGGLPPKGGSLRGERRSGLEPDSVYKGGWRITGSARDACISRERWVLGGCPDPSAAIEVSLGGLPPKGGGSEGEGGRDSGKIHPPRGSQGGRRITGSA